MFELYIKNKKVDLPDNFKVLWTYSSTDLTNPTAIKNTFTKQVELPGTANNNNIFNHLYKIDSGYEDYVFNPNVRNEFVLTQNGMLIESGYIQLNKISRKASEVTYSITLFGGLGDFFYNLDSLSSGEKKSLANLTWRWLSNINFNNSTQWYNDAPLSHPTINDESSEFILDISPKHITLGWKDLARSTFPDKRTIDGIDYTNVRDDIMFMPFDTGKPDIENFDASKVIIDELMADGSNINNVLNTENRNKFFEAFPNHNSEGVEKYAKYIYTPDGSLTGKYFVAGAQREISQLEAGALINSQMIPAFRVGKFLDTIKDPENNGGYTVNYSTGVLSNQVVTDGYVCLDRIKTDELYGPLIVSDNNIFDLKWITSTGDYDPDIKNPVQLTAGNYFSKLDLVNASVNKLLWRTSKEMTSSANIYIGNYFGEEMTRLNGSISLGNLNNAGSLYQNAYVLFPYDNVINGEYRKEYKLIGKKLDSFIHWKGFYARDHRIDKGDAWGKREKPTITFNLQDINDNVLQNLSSYSCYNDIGTSNRYYNVTLFFDIVKIVDNNNKYIAYVQPYILATSGIDAPLVAHLSQSSVQTQIEDWLSSIISGTKIGLHINWDVKSWFVTNVRSTITNYKAGNLQFEEVNRDVEELKRVNSDDTITYNTRGTLLTYVPLTMQMKYNYDRQAEFDIDEAELVYLETQDPSEKNMHIETQYTWCFITATPNTSYISTQRPLDNTNHILYYFNIDGYKECSPVKGEQFPLAIPVTLTDHNLSTKVSTTNYVIGDNNTKIEMREQNVFKVSNMNISSLLATKESLLSDTNSPFEYFTSLAKLLNWKFEYKPKEKVIDVMTEDEYYNIESPQTLTIDYDSKIEVTPYLQNYQNINLSLPYIDNYADYLYNKLFGTSFNELTYKNNYQFNNNSFYLLENNIFKSSLEFVPASPVFNNTEYPFLPCALNLLGGTKVYRFNEDGEGKWFPSEENTFDQVEIPTLTKSYKQNIVNNFDVPLLSCYDKDYSYVSPKNTIVLFNGFISNTKIVPGNYISVGEDKRHWVFPKYFGITSQQQIFNKLNNGNPCYLNDFRYNRNDGLTSFEVNTLFTVWPTDIPMFSLVKFMDNTNKELLNTKTSLLTNLSSYYPINGAYNLHYRFKSTTNGTSTSGYPPMQRYPRQFRSQDPAFVDDPDAINNPYIFDAPIPYTNYNLINNNGQVNPMLNNFAISSETINKYIPTINNIIDKNARQIKLKARLNMEPKKALKYIYGLNGGRYIISKIENYDISQTNPFADVTLQRIIGES